MRLFFISFMAVFFALAPVKADPSDRDTPIEQEAEEKTTDLAVVNVPIITFRQKVDSIVSIKKHPAVLQASLDQDGRFIESELTITNDQNRKQAKSLAEQFLRFIKKKSLDDDPKEKDLGKGLYTYKIKVTQANKTVLATGIKRFDEDALQWAINDEGVTDPTILEDDSSQ